MFARLARFSYRFRWPILIVGGVLAPVAAVLGGQVFSVLRPGGYDDPSTESYEARQLTLEKFGIGRADVVALFTVDSGTVADAAPAAAIQAAVERAKGDQSVLLALSFFNTGAPNFVSKDKNRTFAVFTLKGDEKERIDTTDRIEKILLAEGVKTEFGGEIPVFEAFNTTVEKDLRRAEILVFPITAILLILIFRSLVAAAVPLILGALGIVTALATLRLIASVTPVSVFALNVVTVLGLGLAIDYSLFILNRYREEVPEKGIEGAIVAAVSTTGRAVAFSGVTLAASLVGLFVFPQIFLRSMAIGGIAVTVVAVTLATTILPALLGVLGPRIESLKLPFLGGSSEADSSGSGFWHTVALNVMKRPVLIAVLVVSFLLVLGSPFLRFNPSKQDARALAANVESRAVNDILDSEFLPHETTPHFVVLKSETAAITPDRIGELFDYVQWLATTPGLTRVDSMFSLVPGLSRVQYQDLFTSAAVKDNPQLAFGMSLFLNGDTSRVSAVSDYNIDDGTGQAQVKEIRAVAPPAHTRALVGGNAADLFDTKQSIKDRLPLTLGFIGLATFVVLFLVFGSVTLPFKAMIMNLLSLTASFGAIVFIFQDGRFEGLLHYTSLGTIDVTLPLLMFAIVFGLSMDYEVLMLSRVREEYLRTGDNTLAVARGLEKTGGLITSAAALLVVVISAFATSNIALMKGLGVGMALAIAIDASVVRALLVPATMRLMGHWNWWAPGPLVKAWEKIGLGDLEGHGEPAPRPSGPPPLPSGAAGQPAHATLLPAAITPVPPAADGVTVTAVAKAYAPRLAYLVQKQGDGAGATFQLGAETTDMGRASDNQIVIADQMASGHHVKFERTPQGQVIVHDRGSTNGTLVNGERLTGPRTVEENAEIQIGASIFTLKFVGDAPVADATAPLVSLVSPTVVTRRLRLMDLLVMVDGEEPGRVFPLEGDTISIGRDPRNQIALTDVKLSGFHVRLQRGLDGGLVIEDRGSTNGTFVNGHLLADAQRLLENDLIQVGGTTLQLKRVG
jgi:RND superfamily putative drug exporter